MFSSFSRGMTASTRVERTSRILKTNFFRKNLKKFKQRYGFISQKNANIGVTHSNHYALEGSRVVIRENLKCWCIEDGFSTFN